MRARLVLAVAVVLLLAGCTASFGTATQEATTERETSAERLSYPDAPDDLTNESAKAVALDHEEAYVHNRLRTASEVDSFGVRDGVVVSVEAAVLNESDSSVYVRVQMPYWWSNEDVDSDGGTNAVYYVSEDVVERVHGDEISV